MKVLATSSYGSIDRLQIMEIPEPTPGPGQVRVLVHGTAVNPADFKVITGKVKFLHGRNFPLVMGYDFAGEIETVASGVTDYKIGDRVFGFLAYGVGSRQGAFGEKIVANIQNIAKVPDSLSLMEAGTSATAALTALQGMRASLDGTPGKQVLIHGASGGVGCYAVQIAHILGAKVTATCSAGSTEFVKSLGADEVLDYRKVSPADLRDKYDVFFDVVSNQSFFKVRHLLKPGGRFVTLLPSPSAIAGLLLSPFLPAKCRMVMVKCKSEDLKQVAQWFEEKRLKAPIDRTFPLQEVAQAIHQLEKGGVRGKIAISVRR